jgi:hypothetical protein
MDGIVASGAIPLAAQDLLVCMRLAGHCAGTVLTPVVTTR